MNCGFEDGRVKPWVLGHCVIAWAAADKGGRVLVFVEGDRVLMAGEVDVLIGLWGLGERSVEMLAAAVDAASASCCSMGAEDCAGAAVCEADEGGW